MAQYTCLQYKQKSAVYKNPELPHVICKYLAAFVLLHWDILRVTPLI